MGSILGVIIANTGLTLPTVCVIKIFHDLNGYNSTSMPDIRKRKFKPTTKINEVIFN